SRRRHTRFSRDWSSDVCSSDLSLLGRPYPSWDVYPTWELDEAWRECLAAQHHDNHECEGLCGFIGFQQFDKASAAASEVYARSRSEERRVGKERSAGWEAGQGE